MLHDDAVEPPLNAPLRRPKREGGVTILETQSMHHRARPGERGRGADDHDLSDAADRDARDDQLQAGEQARVAVLGASGYTGAEVMRLCALHAGIKIVALTGDKQAGKVRRWTLLVVRSL